MDIWGTLIYALDVMLKTILEYLNVNRLIALTFSFLMAGGIATMIDRRVILKYFGPDTPRLISYIVAALSGCILVVCSCTVLPLISSLYKRGASIGPITTLLFSAPAINILAIFYSAAVFGWDIGFLRALYAITLAIIIGLTMELLFERGKKKKGKIFKGKIDSISSRPWYQTLTFFLIQLLILLTITASPKFMPFLNIPVYDGILTKHVVTAVLVLILAVVVKKWYKPEEIKGWLLESYTLAKMLFPLLIIGVAIAGLISVFIPPEYISRYVGENTLFSNFIASLVGALMYFATLTEVPIVKTLMDLGMHVGPAMALLLAGPSLSIPTVLTISRVFGVVKSLTYLALVVVLSTLAGYITGIMLG
ncbi:MAG TPA: permease [Methanothermococcus okinawensis]|uniref:Permease n=1 Tax=Methanothermococcus okinawensis TaxID=155863 RepID=A0A833E6J7_9EURY|nr:permease [Methanothermococcus okinawensis]HIP91749.1 permease [Methanothermococcus okinawensis]